MSTPKKPKSVYVPPSPAAPSSRRSSPAAPAKPDAAAKPRKVNTAIRREALKLVFDAPFSGQNVAEMMRDVRLVEAYLLGE